MIKGPLLEVGMTVYIPVEIVDVDGDSDEETYKAIFCDNKTEWIGHDSLIEAMKEADNSFQCSPNKELRKQLLINEIDRLHRELGEIG